MSSKRMENFRFIYLEAFVEVIDSRSFTKAASKLMISQSNISKHITRLEELIDKGLLDSFTKELKPAGERFLPKAREIIRFLMEAREAAQAADGWRLLTQERVDFRFIQLDAFLNLAYRNNFTEAAKDVGCNQSTISRHVPKLELWVGMQLFDRDTKQITLAGEEFVPKACKAMSLFMDAR